MKNLQYLRCVFCFFVCSFINAQSQDCEFETSQNGVLTITSDVNTILGLKTKTVHYWQFDAREGLLYNFKIPNTTIENAFSFRILDENNTHWSWCPPRPVCVIFH